MRALIIKEERDTPANLHKKITWRSLETMYEM